MASCVMACAPPPSVVWTAAAGANSGANPNTFSVAISAASAQRHVFAYVVTDEAVTSVTIGGVSASQVSGTYAAAGAVWRSAIYVAAVPTGTTANIVVTTAAGSSAYVEVFAAYHLRSLTPHDVASDNASPITLSLNVPARGVAIGGAWVEATASWTWTGMTETHDAAIASTQPSAGTYTATSAVSPLSVALTNAGSGFFLGATASFR